MRGGIPISIIVRSAFVGVKLKGLLRSNVDGPGYDTHCNFYCRLLCFYHDIAQYKINQKCALLSMSEIEYEYMH